MSTNTPNQSLALNAAVSAQNPNQAPIAILDSGVGGLSIAQCIKQQLPYENLLYVADTLYAPYGDKSAAFIQQRLNEIAQWCITRDAKALVVACNTATVNAIDQLRQQVSLPVIGVEPAIKPATKISKNNKVAILVTKATAANQRFLNLVAQYRDSCQVSIQPCPGLVELIEQNKQDTAECRALLSGYLRPLMAAGVDTLVLGCTHYPLIMSLIKEVCGNELNIMETARPVTAQLQRQLTHYQLLNDSNKLGTSRFYSSKFNKEQQALFNHILPEPVQLHSFP
ncbi:glutamate racemase [Colwellia chukchiensis]|uniref:Glutamate racemase n=1 Tax=Colwellia chukchiensis TaxID=641665 RepID=A0A1H7S3U8_9GAMM|nr:glutamate racemase [Colwellia chukchiensis]SEL67038.1 glutamate racemase [Colwellia chukchiensis]